jgi:HAD superfamily phosphoserine phosphatase-like hydrolase
MKISVFDIDGTLSKGFLIQKFPKWLRENHSYAFEASEYENINKIMDKKKAAKSDDEYPYKDFAVDLVKAYGRGIKGRPKEHLDVLARMYVDQNPNDRFSFANRLVQLVKDKGYRPIAVSGSPYEIVLPFSVSLGIPAQDVFASTYEHENGQFTGIETSNCAIDTEKKKITDRYFAEHNVDMNTSAGFGDSDHDLSFLEPVGYAVAMKPNDKLRKVAENQRLQKVKRWLILDDDKKVLNEVDCYLP